MRALVFDGRPDIRTFVVWVRVGTVGRAWPCVNPSFYAVGPLLGHADPGSIARYAHLADEHDRWTAGRIPRIVGVAMTAGRKREADHGE